MPQGNHIYTSGATGTNAAVIKGALRANCPDKLTVLLPQSLHKQPFESQELLAQVRGHAQGTEKLGGGQRYWRKGDAGCPGSGTSGVGQSRAASRVQGLCRTRQGFCVQTYRNRVCVGRWL